MLREEAHARRVAARTSEVGDETELNRIRTNAEHDRDCRGRGLCRERRRDGNCDDHCYLTAHQLRRHFRQSAVVPLCPTVLDRYVLPLQIAGLGQTLAEYCHPVRNRLRRSGTEITHHRHRWLLRARRERPRGCRTAKQRDELASS